MSRFFRIEHTQGSLNSKLHTVCDEDGKPICLLLLEGDMRDDKGAVLSLRIMPDAQELIAHKGIDTEWVKQALFDSHIKPSIPPRKGEALINQLGQYNL